MSIFHSDVPGRVWSVHSAHTYTPVSFNNKDVEILRMLGSRYAEIASLPIQKEKAKLWRDLNDLIETRPLVWHNEVPWHEMNVDNELNLTTSTEFCRRIEAYLRKNIYLWEHMRADMVVESCIYSPKIIENTGIGFEEEGEVRSTDPENEIISRHFESQIKDEEDVNRIRVPEVRFLEKESEEFLQVYKYLFEGIINVETEGVRGFWFAPWDDIITFMGVEETLTNLILKPELMHKLIDTLTNAYLKALYQYEEQGLISSNCNNSRVGSGAYGYTSELPNTEQKNRNVRTYDIWGNATPQIFSEVSPSMHEEFGLNYEAKWLEKFGLCYYGCCEPLHNKIHILKKIKNLRKISISPWADPKKAAERIQRDYVISLKPNPVILALDTWDAEAAEIELKNKLEELKGCNVEIIIKDISTVRYEPQRLWEWVDIASRLVQGNI
jgi:hypothetical protein